MDDIRVLHAADLHIDSPMRGLVEYDGAPVAEIRAATRNALRALVAEAIDRQVHLLLLAGDLYDGAWRDYNTGLFVVSQLAELHEADIPVVLVYGNHDAESQLTKRLRLPPNTTALASREPATCVFDEIGVAVHGQSYPTRAVEADLSLTYPAADPGLVNIGMLHTCFDGTLGHDRYAPCTLEGLRSKRYDYWALGHVHAHAVLSDDPLIVYPGNLQGRQIRETGAKGASLVTFTGHEPRLEQIPVDVVRWERCPVDFDGAGSLDDCLERARGALTRVCDGGSGVYAVRVELSGATVVNSELRAHSEQITNELRALALTLGPQVWIEKVALGTRPRKGSADLADDGIGAEIGRLVTELGSDLSAFRTAAASPIADLDMLWRQLQAEGTDELDETQLLAALDDAADLLVTLLRAEEDQDAH